MDQITDNIWLGNVEAASDVNNLKKEGFKKILCVMDYGIPKYKENESEIFNRKIIEIVDTPTYNILKHFGECLNFIKGNEKILVHWMAGQVDLQVLLLDILWGIKKCHLKML